MVGQFCNILRFSSLILGDEGDNFYVIDLGEVDVSIQAEISLKSVSSQPVQSISLSIYPSVCLSICLSDILVCRSYQPAVFANGPKGWMSYLVQTDCSEDKDPSLGVLTLNCQLKTGGLSGRVLDSRLTACGFEPHRRLCVVSLSKAIYHLLSTGSTHEDPSQHN